jgi:hypothetical protein
VQLLHAAAKTHARFDDPNLVSHAGLVPVMRLAERVELEKLAAHHVRLTAGVGANAGVKIGSLIAGMIASADDIDGMDLLHHGAIPATFGGIRAPSTLGSFLRAFTHGNVRQLAAVHRRVLAALAARTPLLPGGEELVFIDVDSTQKRVFGPAKQGAAFGHTKIASKSLTVRGLSALIATVCTPIAAPVITTTRLRGGNAASARGAASLVAEAITTARAAGFTGLIVVRVDSAFYNRPFVAAARRNGAHFSVTARMDPKIRRAIADIDEDAWTAIEYPDAVFDEDAGAWISDAEIAEVPYTAFASSPAHATHGRLIVRRVATSTPAPPPKARASCSPPTAITRYLPTARFSCPRPNPSTAATPSSNRSSPTCSMGRWRTCPLGNSAPTPLGCNWPPPPTPSPAHSARWPRLGTRSPAAPSSAPNSSTSPPVPPAAGEIPSPGTYRGTGPGNSTGSMLFTPPTADHRRWLPKYSPRSDIASPARTAHTTAQPRTGHAGRRGQQLPRAAI